MDVYRLLLENLDSSSISSLYFFKLTKGFVKYKDKIVGATEAARDMFEKKFGNRDFLWTTVGGPVRAVDLANRIPSASMYGLSNERIKTISSGFSIDYYRIFTNNDIRGVELCSAFKNIYAMATGICDGLYRAEKEGLYHNIIAFLFNQACLEVAEIVAAAGGEKKQLLIWQELEICMLLLQQGATGGMVKWLEEELMAILLLKKCMMKENMVRVILP